jgi:hypothetical protein
MKVQGRCHCGAIAYEAEVDPAKVNNCHCEDCQRLSGCAFRSSIGARAENFRMLKGEPTRYVKTADSGAKRVHAFCSNCGSPVYSSAVENPSSYSLRVGALDQRHELGRPANEIWTKRRLGWVPPLDGAREVEGQP